MTDIGQCFICDEMLIRLARWLRAAGYDTELLAHGASDRDLMDHAKANDRVILTRDRKFLERRGAKSLAFLIISTDVDEQAREITGPLGIDWLKAPFSRCLVDNIPVRPASKAESANLPWPRRGITGPFMSCPKCGRLYWVGGHTRRMLAKLETWSQGSFSGKTAEG